MRGRRLFLIIYFAALAGAGAQVPDSMGTEWAFWNNNFFYNREYYNLIADSYTLAGHKLRFEGGLRPAPHWHVRGGAEVYAYWGQNVPWRVKPLWYVAYRKDSAEFRMGYLDREGRHGIMAPLMQRDRVYLPEYGEWGMQYRRTEKRWDGEAWVAWQRFIFPGDTVREIINGGIRGDVRIWRRGPWRGILRGQWLVYHRGGQVNLKGRYLEGLNNMLTVFYGAGGLRVMYAAGGAEWEWFGYGLYHWVNTADAEDLIFGDGRALWTGIAWRYKGWTAGGSFWHANRFNAPTGEDIFQTVSRRVDKYLDDNDKPLPLFARHTEPVRNLWLAGASYGKDISRYMRVRGGLEFFFQPYWSDIPEKENIYPVENQLDGLVWVEILVFFNEK